MNNGLYTNGFIPNTDYINNSQKNYVTDYLKKHLGKKIELHASFCDSVEWRDTVFVGTLEDIGKDYIVINNNNNSSVIWSIYIDYLILLNNYD